MSTGNNGPDGKDQVLVGRATDQHRITSVFQPIVWLADGEPRGFQALSRPHGHDVGAGVEAFFRDAVRHGTMSDVDRRCRRSAILNAVGLYPPLPLHIKLELAAVDDVLADAETMASLAIESGLTTARIVLEVGVGETGDPLLQRALAIYRSLGFAISVDGICSVEDARNVMDAAAPHEIKISRQLTNEIDDPATAEAVLGIGVVAVTGGSGVVAQGIETAGHADAYRGLGVAAGQGFLFGRPTVVAELLGSSGRGAAVEWGVDAPVLAQKA